MIKAPLPANEKERLKALREYSILDSLPSQNFDDLASLASIICQTPVAMITLIDESRAWFKTSIGFKGTEGPREIAFCNHTLNQNDVLVVDDATKDERFHDNPHVTIENGVRFYAGTALCSPEGYKLGTLCVVDCNPRTITDMQKQALSALARQVESQLELHKIVIQMQMLYSDLAQAEKRAWAAYNVKADFLANMSHEIRTPLNGIIGMSDLLLESNLGTEDKRRVQVLQTCGSSLLALINDILDFSKLEAGKVEIESIPVDLARLVEDTSELFRPISETKGVSLNMHCPKDLPHVMGDMHRLRQILNNLIGNALKFTDQGKIHVSLDVQKKNGKAEVQISVSDTGIGIPEHAKEKIFRSFSQVDAATSRLRGGSGLGLAISNNLSSLMGGKMWFESRAGEGSTFYFKFETCLASSVTSLVKNEPEFEIHNAEAASILIAEDNATNRMVILGYLERFGLQADTAANGREAIDKMKLRNYDLIFMDCQMPILDGYEATKLIVASQPDANLRPRIVALTANARKEDREKCLQAGMDDHLSKPFKMADLKKVLSLHLGEKFFKAPGVKAA